MLKKYFKVLFSKREAKMTKPISEQRLYNITLFYLERFDASALKVKQMLERRIQKEKAKGALVPNNTQELIQNVILKMQNLGYINDERFAQTKIKKLCSAGKSKSFILNKLKQAGITGEIAKKLLSEFDLENESSDYTRAEQWLKKHRKGQFRSKNADDFYQKDLAALARAGFSYEIASNALKTKPSSDEEPYF